MGRHPHESRRRATRIRGCGAGFWLALAGVSLGVRCSPGSVHAGPDVEDGGPTDAVEAADGATEDVAESADEVAATEDGRSEDVADDASEHVLSCDDPVWMDWAGLEDGGDGCQEVLREPGIDVCRILPLLTAGGGGYLAFAVGEGIPTHPYVLMDVGCGSHVVIETIDSCPMGALSVEYPWFGYTCLWRAEEITDPPPGTGAWVYAVRLYNIATAERRQFHHVRFDPLADTTGHMRGIEIDWPWIATEDCRNGPGLCGIVLINAQTGEERLLSPRYNGADEGPQIDGNRVVFDRWTEGFAWNPWIYDIRTDTASAILMDTIDEWSTQVDGDWVIWVDQRNDPAGTAFTPRSPDLYGWEISTGTEQPLAVAPGAQMQPVLRDGWLLWSDYRNDPVDPSGSWGSTNSDVYARMMPDGPETRITTFPDTREWVIDKDGDWIYVFRATTDHCRGSTASPAHLLRCPLPSALP